MEYLFTRKRFMELVALIEKSKKEADAVATSGFESGASQDGHHDEGYQLSLRETSVKDRRLGTLEEMRQNARVVDPVEQSGHIELGNGVVLSYPTGKRLGAIIDGFVFDHTGKELISVGSPLGKSIVGASVGQFCSFKVGERIITVKVEKIFPPSKADLAYSETD